jgi:O-antigen ligase
MLAALLTIANSTRVRIVLLLSMMAALYASLMSATRGSWLFLLLLPPVVVWLYREKIKKTQWMVMIASVLVAGVLLIQFQPKLVVKPIQRGIGEVERYLENPNKAGSWGSRLEMWRNSIKIWGNHPWFGTGLGDFQHDSMQLVEQGLSQNSFVANSYGHAHSIYFDALATLGGVGLGLLVVALFVLPWRFFHSYWLRSPSPEGRFYTLSGLLCVLAFAVFGLSEGWLSRNPFVTPYVIFLAVFAASLTLHHREQEVA